MKNIATYIIEEINNKWQKFSSEEDDEWTKKCTEVIKDKYSSEYNIEQKWNGSLYFYRKGRKPTLKNLVCAIDGLYDNRLAADFGPNKNLESSLGKEIEEILKNTK